MELLVISSYPEKGQIHGTKTVGVGNYTKATLLSLTKKNPELKIKVLAEILDEKEDYTENRVVVSRSWKRGSIFSIVSLFVKALKEPYKVIMWPVEMYMYGGLIHLLVSFPFLLIMKFRGRKVLMILHQVLGGDISVFEKNRVKSLIFSFVRGIFYRSLLLITSKTVVFEEEFKNRLGNNKNVLVIPHAVIKENVLNKDIAKEKLGLDKSKKYVFYFGYLSPYKGIEELLSIWEPMEDVQLIVGGGGNPNHMKNPDYKAFVEDLLSKASSKQAITTGFIPEDQMGTYFSAVDIIILPYTVFMSSSGPMSHAFSYGRGVLLSSNLKKYFNSQDMRGALSASGISVGEICFDLDKPIRSKILWAVHNQAKLEEFSRKMAQIRSWDVLGGDYNKVISDMSK